jgi:hypothetical protein
MDKRFKVIPITSTGRSDFHATGIIGYRVLEHVGDHEGASMWITWPLLYANKHLAQKALKRQ